MYKLVDSPYFPYRGGKARLRRFIVRWLPLSGTTYIEPFGGRGNILFLMKMASNYKRWIINDNMTYPFFEAIKNYNELPFPVIPKEDVDSYMVRDPSNYLILEPLLRWAGGTSFSGRTGSRNHDLLAYKQRVTLAKKILHDVEIYNKDAIDLLEHYPLDDHSFVYLDPPYLAGNVNIYKANSFDRQKMIDILLNAKYKWALSEYECDDLNQAFGEPTIKYHNVYVSPNKSKVKRMTEVLYTNYDTTSGPNRLNFGDSERPLDISIKLMSSFDKLTSQQFMDICPDKWSNHTKNAQFMRLCCLPSMYFDGHYLYNLDKINYWK